MRGLFSYFPKQLHFYKTLQIKLKHHMLNSMLREEMLLCKQANTKEHSMIFQQQFVLKKQMLHIMVSIILFYNKVLVEIVYFN